MQIVQSSFVPLIRFLCLRFFLFIVLKALKLCDKHTLILMCVTTDVQQRDVRDWWSVDGGHGRGEGSVQGVVEDRRADVGHDGVQQRLTQILLFSGYWRRRGRRLKQWGQTVTMT